MTYRSETVPHGNCSRPGDPLTPRQQEVYEFCLAYFRAHGWPPTYREICGALGWGSVNAAAGHLRALVRKGYVETMPGIARGMRFPGYRVELVKEG